MRRVGRPDPGQSSSTWRRPRPALPWATRIAGQRRRARRCGTVPARSRRSTIAAAAGRGRRAHAGARRAAHALPGIDRAPARPRPRERRRRVGRPSRRASPRPRSSRRGRPRARGPPPPPGSSAPRAGAPAPGERAAGPRPSPAARRGAPRRRRAAHRPWPRRRARGGWPRRPGSIREASRQSASARARAVRSACVGVSGHRLVRGPREPTAGLGAIPTASSRSATAACRSLSTRSRAETSRASAAPPSGSRGSRATAPRGSAPGSAPRDHRGARPGGRPPARVGRGPVLAGQRQRQVGRAPPRVSFTRTRWAPGPRSTGTICTAGGQPDQARRSALGTPSRKSRADAVVPTREQVAPAASQVDGRQRGTRRRQGRSLRRARQLPPASARSGTRARPSRPLPLREPRPCLRSERAGHVEGVQRAEGAGERPGRRPRRSPRAGAPTRRRRRASRRRRPAPPAPGRPPAR